MENILLGAGDAFSLTAIAAVFGGILLGYIVGVVPGLSRPAALAVAVPLTYYMTPIAAIAFLVGVTKASAAGGATGAIMLNTPGEPSSAATCYDGYPLARAGKAAKALKIALYSSVFGDMVSTLVLIALAMPLASFALKMGPVEMTSVMIFALTFIAALSGTSLTKGLVSGIFGILLATVGLDPESATPRLTFGMIELFDGIPLVSATVGMLAFTEMLVQAEAYIRARKTGEHIQKMELLPDDNGVSLEEVREVAPTAVRSTMVGIASGIIPGLGPTIGAFLSYVVAKKFAKPGDRYGEGDIKGVAATEAADNAVLPASFIPLFAIGLPGSVSAAILVAAFMMHGVVPGPLVFEQHPRLIYGIYASMLVASVCMLIVGRVGLTFFARIGSVPAVIIIPTVIVFCTLGSFLEHHAMFSVYAMVVLGVVGYFMQRYGYSVVTFLIGFVIGPLFELSLRQSIIVTNHKLEAVLHHPIAIGFLVTSVAAAIFFIKPAGKRALLQQTDA
ncbi:tripartite tricarboxylate transporter permease [Nitratireductor aquimarinus]|uniref:tripartite tricarboxylate transporter permease n=1 Tax=Nitratireductor TaxID=245876 RepID=UPI0019D35ED2|nr:MULTISPECIES: tripartite tricarboxylate transporter permease [Nitratireductor]MBN7776421.1 tripartite tricarboxylate transporter permease [Nitratireductor pacificus]MBN7779288.1 tripartite tricarboxylate transporter permease [Nitratireductor pacificus]MBN7788095.1 tripartite tricarboxylate transporter permease [Nitratireductor aquimarinus]MBY6098142.1 tripartite tricarboxylate transporter permease [Nitratireductor aquimarinus]MCA1259475.1 tripartite tricarboxylate transporter permease [Nitr